MRLGFETTECKMMHDAYAKNGYFFEGLVKVICNHYRETWLKIGKILQSAPFSKLRTKPRKKFLTKAKALVEIFEVVFLDILSYKVRSSVMLRTMVSFVPVSRVLPSSQIPTPF